MGCPFGVMLTLLLHHLSAEIYIYITFCISRIRHIIAICHFANDSHLNEFSFTFAWEVCRVGCRDYVIIQCIVSAPIPRLMVWYRQMPYHLSINCFVAPFQGVQVVISIRVLLDIIPLSFRRQLPHIYWAVSLDPIVHSTLTFIHQ